MTDLKSKYEYIKEHPFCSLLSHALPLAFSAALMENKESNIKKAP